MSQRASSWALGHADAEGPLRLVLLVLAINSDVEGEGRMRPGKLARQASLPLESIGQALRLLEQRGLIEYAGWQTQRIGRGSSFSYRVHVPSDYHPELRFGREEVAA